MDDIKKKFQSLVHRNSKNDHQHLDDAAEASISNLSTVTINKIISQLKATKHDPRIDQENIDSVEPIYFDLDAAFDPAVYVLEKFPNGATTIQIEGVLETLTVQYKSVSKRVAELILENHPAYEAELQRVMELQQELQIASIVCRESRTSLQRSSLQFTEASLRMLAYQRRRQRSLQLVKSIKTIKTLQSTDSRLMEMLDKEDFVGAIEICLECLKAVSVFRHYKCISELSTKLNDTLEMIEERLDVALSKTCKAWDAKNYSKIQTAYRLLDKTQTAMDQLHLHYTSSIHNTAFIVVLGYVELISGTGDGNFQKKQYADLCKHLEGLSQYIAYDTFMPCLRDLCKSMWNVLLNYYMTKQWHEQQEGDSQLLEAEGEFTRKYIQQKLEHGRCRLWQDMQLKFKSFLLAIDMSCFKFNEFTSILNLISLLISVGEEFSGTKSEIIQEAMHQQTQNYFQKYHSARIDELHMFLDNEGWQSVPVRSSFTILNLQEFSFMRSSNGTMYDSRKKPAPLPALSLKHDGATKYFESSDCPFTENQEGEVTEDFLADGEDVSDSDEDIDDELRADYIDEGLSERARPQLRRMKSKDDFKKSIPTLTNTSLTVLRLFGKYMRMMSLLEPISFEVIQCLSQLFDYYLYSVYRRFAKDHMASDLVDNTPCVSSKLQATVERISSQFNDRDLNGEGIHRASSDSLDVVVVAMESLVYLAKQLEFLQPYLNNIIPESKNAFLQQFFSQTVCTCEELRIPVYRPITSRILSKDDIVMQIGQIKWDLKDIMSIHNPYVDQILKEFQALASQLNEVDRIIRLPMAVRAVLWQQCGKNAARVFVEGYSGVKKCTNEGRALMQLDFQQFLVNFEGISNIRPVAGREYVVDYIRAFYLPEAQLEEWTKEHKEYTPKQIIAAVNCVTHLNKRAKQRITSQIDDPDRIVKRTEQLEAKFNQLTANIGKKHLNTSRSEKDS